MSKFMWRTTKQVSWTNWPVIFNQFHHIMEITFHLISLFCAKLDQPVDEIYVGPI